MTKDDRVGGIYRQKHMLRAIFRTASLVLLLGGYASYYHFWGRDSTGGLEAPSLRSRNGDTTTTAIHSKNDSDIHHPNFSRLLEGKENEEASSTAPCPALEVANPMWLVAPYAIGTLYMFLALAIVCDEFFVPALEEMSGEHHLNLSMDVAGATLMAAGGSAPELFTSFVGTFQGSDIGIGTIVGSAVFNVLFVIGMCSLLSREVLSLTWWPLFRDSAYYALGLVVLSLFTGVIGEGEIQWWEALILFAMYIGYVALMYFNQTLYKKMTGKELVLAGESESNVMAGEDFLGSSGEPLVSPEASAGSALFDSDPKAHRDFRWPGTFRTGVIQLLLRPESWQVTAGIGIVAKIHGDVDRVFEQIDADGNGSIDKEELGRLFERLGHEISEEEVDDVFCGLDLDNDGTVSIYHGSRFRSLL